jgi:hypothetical protein
MVPPDSGLSELSTTLADVQRHKKALLNGHGTPYGELQGFDLQTCIAHRHASDVIT